MIHEAKQQPTIYALAGGPACGKTSFRKNAVRGRLLPAHAFVHDCDFVMEHMPEYQEALHRHGSELAFQHWELAARELAETQLREAVSQRLDIIYDRTCALESCLNFIKDLVHNHGYRLVMHALYIDINEAVKRSKIREQSTKRHIPPDTIAQRSRQLSIFWPQYLQLASQAYLYDNHDASPKLIVAYENNELKIHDQKTYNKFLSAIA